jgi:glutathione S-transferase
MAIKLYDLAGAEDDRRFSPYCWRVKMALVHKGLAFETLAWRFTEKDAIAFSGATTVPVLVDGNHTVSDSWKIAAYLEQAYPSRPALFGDSDSQALTYFFSHWTVRTLHPLVLRAIVLDIYRQLHEKDKAYWRTSREKRFGMPLEQYGADPAKAVAELRAALEPLRPALAENAFVSGKGPGFADYILFGMFQWARCVSPLPLLEPGDPLHAWRARVLELWGGYAGKAKGYPV